MRKIIRVNKYDRGQAMMLIALAFVGLVAFVGLAIDAGIVFAHIGHLRRSVDAAALSAAGQLRKDWEYDEVLSAAEELILLNLPADSSSDLNVVVATCKEDSTITGCEGSPTYRKMAQVSASLDVNLAFLPIVGWHSITISAEAISEAAAVDLMLVIDTSTSMAYETQSVIDAGDDADARKAAIAACRIERGDPDGCKPFEQVRTAAGNLMLHMDSDFDRIGLVTFDRFAGGVSGTLGELDEAPLTVPNHGLTSTHSDITTKLNEMQVYPVPNFSALCPNFGGGAETGDPRGCMRTNTAAGLMLAGQELYDRGREEAIWVVVLLSDGVANAAYATNADFTPVNDPLLPQDWYCPQEFWKDHSDIPLKGRFFDGHLIPWCTNGGYPRGSSAGDPPTAWEYSYQNGDGLGANSDPDAAARFWADWIGCYQPGQNTECASSGLGAVIFTIALGDFTTEHEGPYPDAGEQLLRYIANVGYNGNPARDTASDPCSGIASTVDCGNYYFSKTTEAELKAVFRDIAERIFTRLTH
jgi:hypothetical protein